jgi:hypothetical protein
MGVGSLGRLPIHAPTPPESEWAATPLAVDLPVEEGVKGESRLAWAESRG